MSDHSEHNPSDHEDPLAGPTWTVGIAGILLLAALVLGGTALTYQVRGREQARVQVAPAVAAVEALRAEQRGRLAGPARRELRDDSESGEPALVIPIDAAIDLVVRDAAGQRPGR
ncbi:MAG: hypothetical protein KF817_09265 [Phycisphaeraceae bacterium]|nr:hypothetical protein [Phycisphaeraceae bacterium]